MNAVSPSTRNDPKIRPSTVPMEVIMLKLDIIDGHLDSSVFSSIIIVDTGTLAIATIWNAIRTSIYSPIPVTNGMKIRFRRFSYDHETALKQIRELVTNDAMLQKLSKFYS